MIHGRTPGSKFDGKITTSGSKFDGKTTTSGSKSDGKTTTSSSKSDGKTTTSGSKSSKSDGKVPSRFFEVKETESEVDSEDDSGDDSEDDSGYGPEIDAQESAIRKLARDLHVSIGCARGISYIRNRSHWSSEREAALIMADNIRGFDWCSLARGDYVEELASNGITVA